MNTIVLALVAWSSAALLIQHRPQHARSARQRQRPRSLLPPASTVRLARPAGLAAGLAIGLLVHPVAGLVAAMVLWWLMPAVVGRLDSAAELRRRADLDRQLPLVAGLLAACLTSGATLQRSLMIVSEAVPDPASGVLSRTASSAMLGGPPSELAALLGESSSPGWQALGNAVVRSGATGAPLADLLGVQADQALHAWHSAASARARAVAVRSVLPLALCYLPAFLLLGVAPVVAGLLGSVSVG